MAATDHTPQALSVFDRVKELVPIERYFEEQHQLPLRPQGRLLVALCPWHEEREPSFQIDPEKRTFICRGKCAISGTIIDAVMIDQKLETPLQAVEWINDHYQLGLDPNAWKYASTERHAKDYIKEAHRTLLEGKTEAAKLAHELLQRRKFTDATIRHFQLGADDDRRRLVIPVHDRGGHLVAWSGRALIDSMECPSCHKSIKPDQIYGNIHKHHANRELQWWQDPEAAQYATICPECGARDAFPRQFVRQHPRYRDSGGSWGPPFNKRQIVYNLHRARSELKRLLREDPGHWQPLLIAEGFADVWACYEAGFVGAVAFNSAVIHPEQAEQIVAAAVEAQSWIGLLVDNDTTGHNQAERNILALEAAAKKLNVPIEIRVNYGTFRGPDSKDIKDPAEYLERYGAEELSRALREDWWSSVEYRVRRVINMPMSEPAQQQAVKAILAETRSSVAVDGIVPLLAEHWNANISTVRKFVLDWLGKQASVQDNRSLLATVQQAFQEARLRTQNVQIIQTDFQQLNKSLENEGFEPGWLNTIAARSGTGKTTLAVNLLWQFCRRRIPCIFFSLEQPKTAIYTYLAQITLNKTFPEIKKMIANSDPALKKVDEVFGNYLIIVDNVPTEENPTIQPMTPRRIKELIHDVNIMFARDRPIQVVMVDHLGMMSADEDAPRETREHSFAVPGYVMDRFYTMGKELSVCFFVLQQLNIRGAPPGEPVTMQSLRGVTQQVDLSNTIIGIYRPEQKEDLTEAERVQYRNQYILHFVKNRHGPQESKILLYFDPTTKRIVDQEGSPLIFGPRDGSEWDETSATEIDEEETLNVHETGVDDIDIGEL